MYTGVNLKSIHEPYSTISNKKLSLKLMNQFAIFINFFLITQEI